MDGFPRQSSRTVPQVRAKQSQCSEPLYLIVKNGDATLGIFKKTLT